MAITVSTTSPAEARAMIGLLRTAPASLSYEVYLGGVRVARRSSTPGEPEVTDPGRWPPPDPELR